MMIRAFTSNWRQHAESAHKFSENDIAAQSANIIAGMREARMQGRTVMFYSCVIGSIPGETGTAIEIVARLCRQSA